MPAACRASGFASVVMLCGAALAACTPKASPQAPLPAPAITPAPFSTARFPPEVAKLVEDVRGWRTYTATLKLGAQQHVLATTTVIGVPAARQLRIDSTMGAGGMGSRTEAVFDGTVGVARSAITGTLPEGTPAALRVGMAAGAGNKHLRVDQAILGTPGAPFVFGLSLGTTGLGMGQDLQGTVLSLLDADSWREVAPATIDGIACRVFEASYTPEAAFERALRGSSTALLQLEAPATRATLLQGLRAEPGKIAVGPAGELVAAILGPMGMTLRLTALDTATAPAADAFSVGSLDAADADDISAAVRTKMEPLVMLLADKARLDAILQGMRADWDASAPAAPDTQDTRDAQAAPTAARKTGRMVHGAPVILGKIDAKVVTQTVDEHASQLAYCYDKELAAMPALAGKLVLRWVINAQGAITMVNVLEDKVVPQNKALQECLSNKIRTHRYPAIRGGGIVLVTMPFEFAPN